MPTGRPHAFPGTQIHAPVRQVVVLLNGGIQAANRGAQPSRLESREVIAEQAGGAARRGHEDGEGAKQTKETHSIPILFGHEALGKEQSKVGLGPPACLPPAPHVRQPRAIQIS